MPRNFEGLGIGVEVDEGDSTRKLKGLAGTVDGLWSDLKGAAASAGAIGRKIGRGLGNVGRKGMNLVGGVTTGIGLMIDKAMSPELDTAYSSMFAGFNKSFSAMTAGLKGSEKEMAQARKIIGGTAFGMAEDMEGAAKSWVAFRSQGIDLTNVLGTSGLKGAMKDLIRITSVFGIEGEQLAVVMSGLVKGFGFTEEAVGKLGDKIAVVGKEFNMGREAVQAWPAIFETLNKELADFGKTLTPEEIEQLTLSIVQLGGGLKDALGLPAQSALEVARTMFTTLAGERKNIINMFRGMGGEFGDVAKQLMETGGDVNSIFKMMTEGDPLKFMDTLREMGEEAVKRGGETGIAFQRMVGTINQALGPDVTFAMKGNWDKVRETISGIPAALGGPEAQGALKNMAKQHWKSSITAGEAWDRMIEGMKSRLFKLSSKEVGGWQKNMKKGFESTFKVIEKMAKKDGPVGELTTRLLAVQRVGLSALIPGLASLSPLLGGLTTSMLPVMTALGSMGFGFDKLGMMAKVGGPLFLVFQLLKYGPEEAWERLKSFGKDLWDLFGDLFPNIEKKIKMFFDSTKRMDFGKVVKGWFKKINVAGIFKRIRSVFNKVPWRKVFAGLTSFVREVIKTMVTLVMGIIKETDWIAVFKEITIFLIDSVIAVVGGIKDAIVDGIVSILEDNPEIKKSLEDLFGKDFVKTIEDAGKDIDGTTIYYNVVAGAESAINRIVEGFGWMKRNVVGTFESIKTVVTGVWDLLMGQISLVYVGLRTQWKKTIIGMASAFEKWRYTIEEKFATMTDTLMYPFEWISHKLKGWVADIVEKMFGTKQKPTALSKFMDIVLGEQSTKILTGIRAMGEQNRKLWRQQGGANFEGWWDKQKQKEREQRRAVTTGRQAALGRELAKQLAVGAAGTAKAEAQIKQAEYDMGAYKRHAKATMIDYMKTLKQMEDYDKQAQKTAEENIARDKAEEEAEEKKGKKKRRRGKGKGKKGAPTVEERAEGARVEAYIPGIDEYMKKQDKALSRMEAISKSPLNAYLNVNLDNKTLAKGQAKVERKAGGGMRP